MTPGDRVGLRRRSQGAKVDLPRHAKVTNTPSSAPMSMSIGGKVCVVTVSGTPDGADTLGGSGGIASAIAKVRILDAMDR